MQYLKGHKREHEYDIFEQSKEFNRDKIKCSICNLYLKENLTYRCVDCYDINMCSDCYTYRKNHKTKYSSLHKSYHRFEKVYVKFNDVEDKNDN